MLNDYDIDPDENFYGVFLGNGDKYYLDVEFKNISKDNSKCSLVHVNARSLNKKSNSTASAVQVEANLQEELSVHLHFRKLKCC